MAKWAGCSRERRLVFEDGRRVSACRGSEGELTDKIGFVLGFNWTLLPSPIADETGSRW